MKKNIFKIKNENWSKDFYLKKIKALKLKSKTREKNNVLLIKLDSYDSYKKIIDIIINNHNLKKIDIEKEETFDINQNPLSSFYLKLDFNFKINQIKSIESISASYDGAIQVTKRNGKPKKTEDIKDFYFKKWSTKKMELIFDKLEDENGIYKSVLYDLDHIYERYIFQKKIDPSKVEKNLYSGLVIHGNLKILKLMLDDERLNCPYKKNEALRMFIAFTRHHKSVELLLNDKSFTPHDENGWALGWAASCGHNKILSLVLKDGRIDPLIFEHEHCALINASKNKHVETIKILLSDERILNFLNKKWIEENIKDKEMKELILKLSKVPKLELV